MNRILIVPAAGRGSRLSVALPKALVHVNGHPMLDHLLCLHGRFVDAVVVVVAPVAAAAFDRYTRNAPLPVNIAVQHSPTGMLDAILEARDLVARLRPRRVVVTWCDQVAVMPETVRRLTTLAIRADAADLVFPTLECDDPYIHFERDARRSIVAVRHRREGDEMPPRGETDMGLFDLSHRAYSLLEQFAADATTGRATRERNFLPFIPWLAARGSVETFSGQELMETIGINTPEDLAAVEAHLRRRTAPS